MLYIGKHGARFDHTKTTPYDTDRIQTACAAGDDRGRNEPVAAYFDWLLAIKICHEVLRVVVFGL